MRILGLTAGGVHHVAANEVFPLRPGVDVLEVRNGDARLLAVVEPARSALELRQDAGHSPAADLVHHVLSERAARIRQATLLREQQQPRVLERRRGQDHPGGVDVDRLHRVALDVGHALRTVLAIHPDPGNDAVGPNLEMAGLERRTERHRDRIEHRADIAAVDAVAAVVTRRAAVVGPGQLREAAIRRWPTQLPARGGEDGLGAVERHGRHEDPIGELR